eukprot:g56452.t1
MLGISPDTIRHMGRWKSLSYQLYVRITDDAVRAAQAGLGALGGVQGRVRRGLGWQAEMFGGWPVERAIAWSEADLEDVAARFNCQDRPRGPTGLPPASRIWSVQSPVRAGRRHNTDSSHAVVLSQAGPYHYRFVFYSGRASFNQ